MSYRVLPKAACPQLATSGDGTNYGVHDTMRNGLRTIRSEVTGAHPLENHLSKWDETQEALRMTMLSDVYGMHAPLRLKMEKHLVSQKRRIPVLKNTNLAMEILTGRDQTIDFEDYLGDGNAVETHLLDVHGVMETSLRMSKTGAL
ncbi:hypothetical protein HDU76_005561 [Blyttiomyces sp. JEL0837]|nr:hypothetical protein HDU76_005561 [Blyttiomyces sp. JEL0837]